LRLKIFHIFILFTGTASTLKASNIDSSTLYSRRKVEAWTGLIGGTVAVHSALYTTWYSEYPKSRFHWFNDNKEWKQMDKVGHAFSSYFIGVNSAALFRFSGYSQKRSALYGALVGVLFQTPLEVMDGYNSAWGASTADLVSNTVGTIFAGIQNYKWGKPRIPMRITFHTSSLAGQRPNMLGTTLPERLLKDYNGQTYWIDLNPNRLKMKLRHWPKWLGINLGYGADGLLGGDDNIWTNENGTTIDRSDIPRYRQYYIGPSISFAYLQYSNKHLYQLLGFISERIRLPMPALEYNAVNGFKFHSLYW
jgi:VanZ family protein